VLGAVGLGVEVAAFHQELRVHTDDVDELVERFVVAVAVRREVERGHAESKLAIGDADLR
jgi:hypothetical protein